jgi:hypothetical protein
MHKIVIFILYAKKCHLSLVTSIIGNLSFTVRLILITSVTCDKNLVVSNMFFSNDCCHRFANVLIYVLFGCTSIGEYHQNKSMDL